MAAINAKSEALDDLRDLSSEELDAVSGGWGMVVIARAVAEKAVKGAVGGAGGAGGAGGGEGGQGGQNDPAQMFQQIMQQLTQGQG